MTDAPLWPVANQTGLNDIEAIPLNQRPRPGSTYDLVVRAAEYWPHHPAVTTLPSARNWRSPVTRTFGELLADVQRIANLLRDFGVRRTTPVALILDPPMGWSSGVDRVSEMPCRSE